MAKSIEDKTSTQESLGDIMSKIVKEKLIYYNFPIPILHGFMDHTFKVLELLIEWAAYDYIKKNLKDDDNSGFPVWDKIDEAADALGFTFSMESEDYYHLCGEIYSKYKGSRSGISCKLYWEVRKRAETMSKSDKVLLLAFFAVKSILGNKLYCKTNDLLLFARMNGANKAFSSDEEALKNLHPDLAVHYTRRKRETIRIRLAEVFHINSYSYHDRGYYISSKLSLEKLIEEVEMHRKGTAEAYKKKLADTRKAVLERYKR